MISLSTAVASFISNICACANPKHRICLQDSPNFLYELDPLYRAPYPPSCSKAPRVYTHIHVVPLKHKLNTLDPSLQNPLPSIFHSSYSGVGTMGVPVLAHPYKKPRHTQAHTVA